MNQHRHPFAPARSAPARWNALAISTVATRAWLAARIAFLAFATLPLPASAVQKCDLNGESVNPSHGGTTAGKTGLMRCRDADSGQIEREQGLHNGVFMGAVRFYKAGVLERDYSVNEKGNRDGLSREYAATPGPSNTLLREENYRNGSTVGRMRTWYPNGVLERVAMYGDDGREQASAEFTRPGKLRELRCAATALLAPDADDATWCGHGGAPGRPDFYADNGALRGRAVYEGGERRRSENLWDSGKPSRIEEATRDGGSERRFAEDGTLRRESQWTGARRERRTTLEREHQEGGQLVLEKRYEPQARGSRLLSEQRWYLNGQPREKAEFTVLEGQSQRRETAWHDNGKLAFEGVWLAEDRYAQQALGVHKRYDHEGRLRGETHYDARGKLAREREFDEAGKLLRDDELFEDGSRKATQR